MKKANKLIRDKIPGIMDKKKKQYKTKTVTDKQVIPFLCKKVTEELKEFKDSKYSKAELVDLMDVVITLSDKLGYDLEELETMSEKKAKARGLFEENIILLEYEE